MISIFILPSARRNAAAGTLRRYYFRSEAIPFKTAPLPRADTPVNRRHRPGGRHSGAKIYLSMVSKPNRRAAL